MKTNIFKTVLPALAILLAMGLSFAVEANRVNQQGFYFDIDTGQAEQVPGIVDCSTELNEPCTYKGQQVYAELALTNKLYKIEP